MPRADEGGRIEEEAPREAARTPLSDARAPVLNHHRRVSPYVWAIVVLLVGLAAGASYFWMARSSKPAPAGLEVQSLAVLPFKLLGVKEDEEYLGLGMADALITRLSSLRYLIVRPTGSVLKYTDLGQDPLAAGRALGVDSLLDGKIQRSGDQIRVTVQLVRVRDGAPLWAETFDTPFTNLFAVEDTISQQVARTFMQKLTGHQPRRLAKRYTENTEAYQLYLKGCYHLWNKGTEEAATNAIQYFERALEKDPNYALAYGGLAESYTWLSVIYGYNDVPPKGAYPKAKAAALRALEIDDQLAEAHLALAIVRFRYDWDFREAEREYQRAIDLSPNNALAHHEYAMYLGTMGRNAEAAAANKRAQDLDPLSFKIANGWGLIFYWARRYDEAINQYRKCIDLEPSLERVHLRLSKAYEQKGLYEEAVAEFLKARALSGDSPEMIATLKGAYAASGIRGYWQKRRDLMIEQSKRRYISPYNIAEAYTYLGEKDLAFEWLQKAYEERSTILTTLKINPVLDSLRSDPRFADLLRRVGFPP